MADNNYPLAQRPDLDRITTGLTQDTVQAFYPSWYTEHWLNLQTGSGATLTFRFENNGYIGTIIGSEAEAHYFGMEHQKESADLETFLAKRDQHLTIHLDRNSDAIKAVADRIIGGKRITDVQVVRGDANHADYVKIGVDDGSYGAVVFLPGTLITVEYHGREGDKIFGVEGKELRDKSLSLLASVRSGKEITYTDPDQVLGDVYIIPDFAKDKPKQLPGK